MPNPIIIGTVALDTIETPFGKVKDALGGSASYSSLVVKESKTFTVLTSLFFSYYEVVVFIKINRQQ